MRTSCSFVLWLTVKKEEGRPTPVHHSTADVFCFLLSTKPPNYYPVHLWIFYISPCTVFLFCFFCLSDLFLSSLKCLRGYLCLVFLLHPLWDWYSWEERKISSRWKDAQTVWLCLCLSDSLSSQSSSRFPIHRPSPSFCLEPFAAKPWSGLTASGSSPLAKVERAETQSAAFQLAVVRAFPLLEPISKQQHD